MGLTGFPFPYDVDQLLGGAVRILYADPTDVDVPATIADVILMESPYTAQEGWTDLGATKESFTYNRGFDTSGWEIQQLAGNVIEEITDITRTIEVSIAEFKQETLAMIEGAPSGNFADVDAEGGASAQKRMSFGSFSSVPRYRFAFISRRSKQSGIVIESDDSERGRFFMGVAYSSQIAADNVAFEQGKGDLSATGVTFTLFPESGEDAGEEWGAWYDEQAGTIEAAGP
jgi:hypothetical protein